MPQGLSQALTAWMEQFPTDAVRERIVELETKRQEITDEIDSLRASWEMWQRLVADRLNGDMPPEEPPPGKRPSRRAAALAFLSEYPGQAFRLADIYTRLTSEGILDDGRDTYHGLQVALAASVKRGEVERVRAGLYRIAPRRHEGCDSDRRPRSGR